jgi:non-ribosomal peptide synthetase component F
VTLNSLMQAVWAVLLASYNGSQDVVFGGIVSGRPPELAGVERMVGLFLQSIPVRVRLDRCRTFAELARQVQNDAATGEPHHHMPLSELQMLTGVRRTLFDHVVVFENYPFADGTSELGLDVGHVRAFEQMHFDFSIVIHPGTAANPAIEVKFTFNSNVVDPAQVSRMEAHFRTAVAGVLRGGDVALSELDILSDEERQGLARDLAGAAASTSPAGTVLGLFETQAALTPGNTAVEAGTDRITYAGLNARADLLARALRVQGVARDVPVGVFLRNGIDYIATIIAVQKAGGVFVPFDVDQPLRRMRLLLEKVRPAVIVTNDACAGAVPPARVIGWDSGAALWQSGPVDGAKSPLAPSVEALTDRPQPADSMYVLFTSGSTGEPKAILCTHEGVHYFISWERQELRAAPTLRCAPAIWRSPPSTSACATSSCRSASAAPSACRPPRSAWTPPVWSAGWPRSASRWSTWSPPCSVSWRRRSSRERKPVPGCPTCAPCCSPARACSAVTCSAPAAAWAPMSNSSTSTAHPRRRWPSASCASTGRPRMRAATSPSAGPSPVRASSS